MSIRKYRLQVEGMTCTGCERHVETALNSIGAKNVDVNFRRGEAVFELPEHIGIEKAKEAVNKVNYKAGEAEVIHQQKAPLLVMMKVIMIMTLLSLVLGEELFLLLLKQWNMGQKWR